MAKGTVKWFNPTKGYGFIQPSAGGKDVFVHISAVQKAGLATLNEGQTVEYEEIANRGRTSAENLKVLGEGSMACRTLSDAIREWRFQRNPRKRKSRRARSTYRCGNRCRGYPSRKERVCRASILV
jgi:cold shock protein